MHRRTLTGTQILTRLPTDDLKLDRNRLLCVSLIEMNQQTKAQPNPSKKKCIPGVHASTSFPTVPRMILCNTVVTLSRRVRTSQRNFREFPMDLMKSNPVIKDFACIVMHFRISHLGY
jgi:hypothetical protein